MPMKRSPKKGIKPTPVERLEQGNPNITIEEANDMLKETSTKAGIIADIRKDDQSIFVDQPGAADGTSPLTEDELAVDLEHPMHYMLVIDGKLIEVSEEVYKYVQQLEKKSMLVDQVSHRVLYLLVNGIPFFPLSTKAEYFRDMGLAVRNIEMARHTWTEEDEDNFKQLIHLWRKRGR